jgi:polysaccharide pyruvyl transferase CsaB
MCGKIALLGYYGHDNMGDEAILESIKQFLKNWNEDTDLVVISDRPDKVYSEHGIQAVKKLHQLSTGFKSPLRFLKDLVKIAKEIRNSNALIIGGGGLFHDYFKAAPYAIGEILFARMSGKPVIILAVGVGPYKTKLARLMGKIILNQVELITVRDEVSRQWLIKMGVKRPPVHLTYDPVISLEPQVKHSQIDLGEKKCPWFGMSIRPWPYDQEYVDKMVQIADHVVSKYEAQVVFIPMHYGPDNTLSHDIKNKMKLKKSAKVLDDRFTIYELMDVMGKMDIVIGMRLHSLIIASKMNVPVVGLIYDPKVESYLKIIGQECYACNINGLKVEDLKGQIERVYNNQEAIKDDLKKNIQRVKGEAIEQFSIITNYLENYH